jgi:hypothetical protein
LVEIVPLFKGISEDDKFWELFEKKYLLYDDLGTNSEIIVDFRDNLPKYLSDIFYNISNIL